MTLLIRNARIFTLDPAAPRATHLLIAGRRIAWVGNGRPPQADRVIDAAGTAVLPGFVESHMHLFPGAVQLSRLSLAGVADPRAAILAQPMAEDLLMVEQAGYDCLGEPITRHVLDAILPNRPLALLAPDRHTLWANTAALRAAGLLHGRDLPPGHVVVMGEDGLATGELREFLAHAPVLALTANGGRENNGLLTGRALPTPPDAVARAQDLASLRAGLAYCARHGITSIHNMDGDPWQWELLTELDRAGELPLRISLSGRMLPGQPLSDLADLAARPAGRRLRPGPVKLFLDGVIESTTALLRAPYQGHDHAGEPLFSDAELNALVAAADRLGLQVAVHAVGDGAVHQALNAFEYARAVNGARDSRHRIEHIELIDPADLPRLAALGVVASMQPTHAPGGCYDPAPMAALVGAERMALASPTAQLLRAGTRLCLNSDWPVAPLDPLFGLRVAMTRQPCPVDERLDFEQALAGFTRGGAYAGFAEHQLGWLRAGLLADLVVLDGPDPLKARVRQSFCDGELIFDAATAQ